MSDREFDELRRTADRNGTTASEWVRQTLRRAARQQDARDVEQRLVAVRSAMRHSFPSGDNDDMLRDIEREYLAE